MSGISSVGYAAPVYGQRTVTPNNNQARYVNREEFTQEKEPEKKKGSLSILKDIGVSTLALIGLDYLFCKGKHVQALLKFFGVGEKVAQKPATIIKEAEKTKVKKPKVKKPKVKKQKTKLPSETPKGREIVERNNREAKVVEKIDTQHVSAKDRKLVEQAKQDVVTPEMQAKYDREIAFKEMTQEEKTANAINNAKNAEQRKELNSIANNSKGAEELAKLGETMKAEEKALKRVLTDGEYTLDGNRYLIKDGKIQEMTLKGALKPQTREASIANHEIKNNVIERLTKGEGDAVTQKVANAA
jgi:hypothetical protein